MWVEHVSWHNSNEQQLEICWHLIAEAFQVILQIDMQLVANVHFLLWILDNVQVKNTNIVIAYHINFSVLRK